MVSIRIANATDVSYRSVTTRRMCGEVLADVLVPNTARRLRITAAAPDLTSTWSPGCVLPR